MWVKGTLLSQGAKEIPTLNISTIGETFLFKCQIRIINAVYFYPLLSLTLIVFQKT